MPSTCAVAAGGGGDVGYSRYMHGAHAGLGSLCWPTRMPSMSYCSVARALKLRLALKLPVSPACVPQPLCTTSMEYSSFFHNKQGTRVCGLKIAVSSKSVQTYVNLEHARRAYDALAELTAVNEKQ